VKRAHLVYAHPEPKSFVAAMQETARAVLEQSGWIVTLSDLYASAFDPVAKASDFCRRKNPDYLVYALEQRHAVETESLAEDIGREARLVIESDLLVLVFPIFWFSVPAIMKGWIDRVFLSGLFFGGKRVYSRAGMVGKKALALAALGGREHMFGPGAIHGDLVGMMRHLFQGTLGYVGFEVLQPFFAYHVPYLDETSRIELLLALEAHVRRVETLPALPMPSLDDFDDVFRLR
jgi:NAD(P)H dehydrogenase (quinone)